MDALVSSHKGAPSEKLLPDIRFLRKYHQEARILRLLAQSLRALHYQVRANYIFFICFYYILFFIHKVVSQCIPPFWTFSKLLAEEAVL